MAAISGVGIVGNDIRLGRGEEDEENREAELLTQTVYPSLDVPSRLLAVVISRRLELGWPSSSCPLHSSICLAIRGNSRVSPSRYEAMVSIFSSSGK